jgi:Zn ribbon nucleic-acid-binding protein
MTKGFRPNECPNRKCNNTSHPIDGDGFLKLTDDEGNDYFECVRCGFKFSEKEHFNNLEQKRIEAEIESGKFNKDIFEAKEFECHL